MYINYLTVVAAASCLTTFAHAYSPVVVAERANKKAKLIKYIGRLFKIVCCCLIESQVILRNMMKKNNIWLEVKNLLTIKLKNQQGIKH
jgi:hypothetical protein